MDLKEPRALDHAYAVTSHRSQGLSRERVYLTVDTSHSEELVNRRQFYVSVSRAVEDARVYTDDRLALSRAVSREQSRESALEVLDRVPRGSRAELLRSETPLDLARSTHERDERERGTGRAAGSDPQARTLIEELTRLAEELKGREERLGELLAPSEAALRARTEYLDNVMRDELARAEQRVLKLAEEVAGIARRQQEDVVQMSARLAETDAQRWSEMAGHERLRTIVLLLAMLVGGFLAGQVANWRSGAKETVRPAAIEPGTSGSKTAPAVPRRSVGQGTRPTVKPAR